MSTREAIVYADKLLASQDRSRYLEIENSALRAQLRALQERAQADKVFAVMAENMGLRKALESLRADVDLAKDLGAKADAVREECARIAEARGMRELAVELRGGQREGQLSERILRWPTPTSDDAKASGAAGYSTESGRHPGTTLTDAAVRLRTWPTPQAMDAENARPPRLKVDRQSRDPECPGSYRADLKDVACVLRSPPAPTTEKDGKPTSANGRVLNPRFVEALMGWPIGWSDCGSSATESCPSRRREPLPNCGSDSMNEVTESQRTVTNGA